jgi:hypothetical protein
MTFCDGRPRAGMTTVGADMAAKFAACASISGMRRVALQALLVLLASGRLTQGGWSCMPWSAAEPVLARPIAESGPPTRKRTCAERGLPFNQTARRGRWVLGQDAPMNLIGPLLERHVTGRFESSVEGTQRADPAPVMVELAWSAGSFRRIGHVVGLG